MPGRWSAAGDAAAPGTRRAAGRTQPLARQRSRAVLAGKPARRMLCPVARIVSRTNSGAAAPGGASAIAEQGSAVPGARASSRLGTVALGRIVSRAGVQTQRLADAMPGRDVVFEPQRA